MGDEQRSKIFKVALASGSLLIIGAGVYLAVGGQSFGWLIAAFGVLDLATVPFIARMIGAKGSAPGPAPVSTGGADRSADPPAEGTPDPSHNPYARED